MSAIVVCNALWGAFYAVWLLWALWMKRAERRELGLAYHFHRVLVM